MLLCTHWAVKNCTETSQRWTPSKTTIKNDPPELNVYIATMFTINSFNECAAWLKRNSVFKHRNSCYSIEEESCVDIRIRGITLFGTVFGYSVGARFFCTFFPFTCPFTIHNDMFLKTGKI